MYLSAYFFITFALQQTTNNHADKHNKPSLVRLADTHGRASKASLPPRIQGHPAIIGALMIKKNTYRHSLQVIVCLSVTDLVPLHQPKNKVIWH